MPKFLAGCHYNEEEISQNLRKNRRYWPVQINGNKFATSQILEKTGGSCEGADFSWLSSKVSRTLCYNTFMNYVPLLAPENHQQLFILREIFILQGSVTTPIV